ncbi:PAS domain S-box-containing protein [Desulforhopalus singaporensis]|uniref:HTH-type transcriptional regulatory protein TyrR n=2 Tax=Desulforhopalus singaporensis TaxID=91360 RepID=A0A1H0KCG7_9BACT|nr:PAS domain S-box-containing protein [Desulforhopalus singaporensis]
MVDSKVSSFGMEASDFEAVFDAIMRYSKDGLFVTNHEGTVLMVNRATEMMVDFDVSKILGRNVREIVDSGFYDKSCALEVLEKKRAVSMIQFARNGKRILATGIPILGDDGSIRFVLVNDRDITSLENITEALEKELLERDVHYEFSDLGLAATELQDFVVRSSAMHQVVTTAVRAAKYDLTLVITGNSGVGKSMLARMVHRLSDRRNGRFVDVNCGAISDSLIESELFGYEKGAFTGASPKGKMGLFEIADNGTLFLDEIGEIPIHLQVKLLRFLEGGEMVRVGGLKSIKVNTRIIAATNRDLEEMVSSGKFRSDLYFRLNVVPLKIPPLARRREEINPLIDFFLDRFNKEYKMDKRISRGVRNALQLYDFPGNIRELENLVKRLVTMSEEQDITMHNLPHRFHVNKDRKVDDEAQATDLENVKDLELFMIKEAVEKYGSQHKAATVLGLSQSTVSRKLKQIMKK